MYVNTGYLRSWQLLASEDGVNWSIIAIYHNDLTINASNIQYRLLLINLGKHHGIVILTLN
jgi:hypothetical protein